MRRTVTKVAMPPKSKSALGEAPQSKAGAKAALQIGSLMAVIGDEDTVTGMLLAGIGNVDARRSSNFLVVDSKTTPGQIEEAFHRFTKRTDIAVLLINQYIASQIRQTVDAFVRCAQFSILSHLTPSPRLAPARGRRTRPAPSSSRCAPSPTEQDAKSPAILEVPSKEHPYDPEQDAIHRRTKLLLGIRD